MCDLLWSDPLEDSTANNLQPEEMEEWYAVEFFENENRGAGYIFGYTAVMDFLKENNLSTIIRAHDVQRTGYTEHFMHCKENRILPLIITLFSAPNYCGHYGNEAAIMRLEPALKEGIPPEPIIDSRCNALLQDNPLKDERQDLTAPYFPKLIYTRYEWVLDIPYYLPSFENGIQYTLPLIIEKLQNFFEVIDGIDHDDLPTSNTVPKNEEATESLRLSAPALSSSGGGEIDLPQRSSTTPRLSCMVVPVSEWLTLRVRDDPNQRRVSDRIKNYETRRLPMILTSGDAMKRRKSVQALSGSFQNKMKSYLSVANLSTKFDKIKNENRKSEHRPPVT